MKTLFLILALSLLLWPACNASRDDNRPGDTRDAERARQQREAYRDQAQVKLRELDRRIDALRERISRSSERERRDLGPQLDELERRRQFAHEKLEKLGASSREAWEDMKAGLDTAMDDLAAACKRADSRFH